MFDQAEIRVVGNLTRDTELRYTPNGTAVAEFSVAVNKKIPGKNGQPGSEKVSYIDGVAWGKTAEHFAPNLTKGTRVVVFGDLEQESWEDKATGQKRSKHKVKAREIGLLSMGERRESQQEAAYSGGSDGMPF